MKIRNRLYLIFALFFVIFILIGLTIFHAKNTITKATEQSGTANSIGNNLNDLNMVTYEYFLYHEERMEQQWHLAYTSISKLLKETSEKTHPPEEAAILQSISRDIKSIRVLFLKLKAIHDKRHMFSSDNEPVDKIRSLGPLDALLASELLVKSHHATLGSLKLHAMAQKEMLETQRKSDSVIIVTMIIFMVVLLISGAFTIRSIATPISKLVEGTHVIGKGNFDYKIKVKSRDEIGELAASFNTMTQNLLAREEELQKRRDENTRLAVIAEERGELQDWINTFDTFVGKFDPDGIGIIFNEAPLKAGELTKDEVVGKYFPDTKWWSHSEIERTRIVECFKRAKAGSSSRIETNFRRADRTPVPIIFNCQPVMDADGRVNYITAEGKIIIEEVKLRDALQEEKANLGKRVKERTSELVEANKKLREEITERKRMEETMRGRNKVLEQLATGALLEEVLLTLVEGAEKDNPGMICSVLLLDKEKKKLLHSTAPSLPNFYNEAINGLEIGPSAASCGTAAYTGKRVIVEDVMTHPYWTEFCEIAKKAGLRACWSEPIVSSTDQILGTFAMYYREPRKPEQSHLEFIKTTAYLAGIAIEKKRAEEKLRKAHEELEVKVAERTRELALANIRLKEVDRLKSEFLATMSHELRTPLNSIIGFTGIILKGLAGEINEEQRKQLSLVYGSSKHLLNLINDILDLSRIESGKMELSIERFTIRDVIAEVVHTLSPMISPKGLRLLTEIPDETPEIYSDRKKVLQILLNLVNNAVKFTNKGEIKIKCKTDNDHLKVSVSDTGIGIKRENMDNLFESFRQIDGKAQRRYQGAGLGLYLCKKLVTLLGGKIWAGSEYDKGSIFTFTLALRLK